MKSGALSPWLFVAASIFWLCCCCYQVHGGKFDYGLFENFEITAECFQKELALVQQLRSLRHAFTSKKEALSSNHSVIDVQPHKDVLEMKRQIEDLIADTCGSMEDVEGAMKGMIMITDTYDLSFQNLKNGSIDPGLLRVPPEEMKVHQGLHINDFINLSIMSHDLGWYDNAARFLQMAERLAKTHVPKSRHEQVQMERIPKLKQTVIKTHNDFLSRKKAIVGENFKVFPYMLDDTLSRAKKQPKFVKKLKEIHDYNMEHDKSYAYNFAVDGDGKEHHSRKVCKGDLEGDLVKEQVGVMKCHLLHHDNPFLRLAPFKAEFLLGNPFRMIFHDIFTEEEMQWLIDYSTPRLSRTRGTSAGNALLRKNDWNQNRIRIVHKTVQCWIQDVAYRHTAVFTDEEPFELVGYENDGDPDEFEIRSPVLLKLATKLEHATQMVITKRWSSTFFQVTNYGLSGLCESHVDPQGYIEGAKIHAEQKELVQTGDMIATIMGWLKEVPAGGETAFQYQGYEQTVTPRRGSAAFWISLDQKGFRDQRTSHGGCPVVVGSKWILNKWIYYFNQFHKWKCGLTSKTHFQPFKGLY